jgi:hypothetical protein
MTRLRNSLACLAVVAFAAACADANPLAAPDDTPRHGAGWAGGGGRVEPDSGSVSAMGPGWTGGGGRAEVDSGSASTMGAGWMGGGGRTVADPGSASAMCTGWFGGGGA